MRLIQIHSKFEDIVMTSAVARKTVAKSPAVSPQRARPEYPQPVPAQQPGFDYNLEAELFPTHNRKYKRAAFGYRRFARAAEAIQFAIEQLPTDALAGAYLEVREQRFDRNGIRQLYDSDAYPLRRKTVS
jgi:hypothetical protein